MSVLDLIPQTERETLKFRLLALLAVALAFLYQADDVPLVPTLAIVGGYLVYAYFLRTVFIPRYTSYVLLGVMLVIDVEIITAALYLIELNSPIFGLLPVVVVFYALYLGYLGGIASATLSAGSYTGLVVATGQTAEMESILVLQPFFYVLALLVGYVSQQRLQETEQRQGLQQLISAEANARLLLDLAQTLNRVMDPASVGVDMARLGAVVARVPYCLIFARDAEGDVLVYQGSNLSHDPAAGDEGIEESIRAGDTIKFLKYATDNAAPVPIDGQSEGQPDPPAWLRSLGATSVLALPLVSMEENVGLACFVDTGATSVDTQRPFEDTTTFGEIAGKLIGSTRLYAQAERRSRRVATELQQSVEMAGRFRDLNQRKSLRFGPLLIDPGRESLRWHETTLRLTKTEFDLLYLLAEKSGSVVNQETLIREVWGQDYVPQGKVVDVTIHRLRRKLKTFPQGTTLIRTVRGQGYMFVPPERFVTS